MLRFALACALLAGCGAAPTLDLDDGASTIVPGPVGDLEVRGWKIRPGVKRPVLLVHGLIADAGTWARLRPFLDQLGPTLAVSLRGRGRSTAPREPGGFHPARQAEDLAAALDAFGIREAHVIAHSMGVPVALAFYADQRPRVASLILGDFLPGWVRLTDEWLANLGPRPGVDPRFAPAIVADQAHWGGGGATVQLAPDHQETLAPNYQPMVAKLRVPTTVFLGRQSMAPLAGALWWAPTVRVIWRDGGHEIFADEGVVAEVVKALAAAEAARE